MASADRAIQFLPRGGKKMIKSTGAYSHMCSPVV